MSAVQVVASDREMRAGTRALRGAMSHPHPLLRRVLTESLGELCWNDLMRFVDQCDAALLADGVPTAAQDAHASVLDPRD